MFVEHATCKYCPVSEDILYAVARVHKDTPQSKCCTPLDVYCWSRVTNSLVQVDTCQFEHVSLEILNNITIWTRVKGNLVQFETFTFEHLLHDILFCTTLVDMDICDK